MEANVAAKYSTTMNIATKYMCMPESNTTIPADGRIQHQITTMVDWAALRQAAGLSMRDAAAQVGVDKNTICNIENGKTCPSINMAQKLLDGYGYTLKVEKKEGEQ